MNPKNSQLNHVGEAISRRNIARLVEVELNLNFTGGKRNKCPVEFCLERVRKLPWNDFN